jgi:flotillin
MGIPFLEGPGLVPVVIGGIVGVVLIFAVIYATRYVKVGPNQVLVISGRRRAVTTAEGRPAAVGFRIRVGGGAFVWPIFERVDILSLELMTLEVKTPEVYTEQGVPVIVDGVAQIKVEGSDLSIRSAAERFLGMNRSEIANIALQTLEGHLRAILGMLTVEQIYKNREMFAQRVQETASSDLANMGLTIDSFTIRDIRDQQGYLDALGKPRTAQVKRDATVGEAEAARDATILSAKAKQEGETARFQAETKIAEADRDYQMNLADYKASVQDRTAKADLAYDLQKFKTQQLVRAEEVQVEVIEKERRIEVQEKEIQRREKELTATVEKPATAERARIQTLAEAEQFRLRATAEGQADAIRATGTAEADANKARGLAEADIIKAQGFSEAEAMDKKAAAWRQYNEAAVTQMFIDKLPEVASAISAPLAKTDRIVVISSGGDGQTSAGASKVTRDVTDIIAQLPAVIESLTGVELQELVQRVPELSRARGGARAKPAASEAEGKS